MILDEILKVLKNSNQDKAYTEKFKSYTYLELYKFVCNIYKFLVEKNTEKRPIIVYGNKEIYMKATFLACSFAGITYVPVDKSIPDSRVNSIIEQVKPYCIMGDYKYSQYETVPTKEINHIMNKSDYQEINKIYLKPDDIYYIIFTSGSTGTPKGVKVTYSNLDSCIKWLQEITKIQKGVILNQAIYSFDLSVADLYLSLISGSEHYIVEDTINLNFKNIFKGLEESNATLAVMTPSFADLLLTDKSFNKELLPNLKTIIFCGEKLLNKTVEKTYERFDDIKIINSYGPTECTFAVTSIEITKDNIKQDDIPVGIPKEGTKIVILDKNKNVLDGEKIGEILIVGNSVAEGYIEDNTKEAFTTYKGESAYLTGDLGFIKNEILYCIGRKDSQIKFKGYRIELSDIENNFYNLGYIENIKVMPKISENNTITKLVAFIKLKEETLKSIIDIKKDIAKEIPSYMIPKIKIVEELPLNNNGKIDINKLRRIINGE